MAIVKNREYIIGSAVPQTVVPERKPDTQYKMREKEHRQKVLKRQNKVKLKTLSCILGVAILFGTSLARSSNLYEAQKGYNTLVAETRVLHKDNEGLRAKIIKLSAIDNVVAEAKAMNLVQLGQAEHIEADLNRNNFEEEVDTLPENKSIIEKMFSAIIPLARS